MQVFEKIIERLKELSEAFPSDSDDDYFRGAGVAYKNALEIVKQEAEKFGTDTNVASNGWIPVSERLPKENGYYYVTQIVKSISTGKKIAIEKAYVEFSGGKWKRAKHLEVMAWLDIEPYQPKGE